MHPDKTGDAVRMEIGLEEALLRRRLSIRSSRGVLKGNVIFY